MATLKPTEAALRILKQCTVEGNVVKLPPDQLARDLYQEVRKHLELIGGKWKGGKTYGFVFENCEPGYIQQLLDEQANGDGRNLKKEYQFPAPTITIGTPELSIPREPNTKNKIKKIIVIPTSPFLAVLKKVKEVDQGPSCSLAEAINKQDLFINSTLAQLGMNILWKLFREFMITSHGLYLNLETMIVNPIKIV